MPLPLLAIPVLHSSGAWIAYAGCGYLGGTLSSSWVGAFILGNSTALAGLGLVSGAGIASASGALAGFGISTATGLSAALTSLGFAGAASWVGVAPATTFLGLTAAGWTLASGAAVVAGLAAVFSRRLMAKINFERAKGGLKAISVQQIYLEVRQFEKDAKRQVFKALAKIDPNVQIYGKNIMIFGSIYSISKLHYRINRDGSEEIGFERRSGRFFRVYLIKPSAL